jgi:simple sugar transport system substrate-binding protein
MMKRRTPLILLVLALLVAAALHPAQPTRAVDELVVGFVLVGPQNDKGWSEAHFRGSEYVKSKIPGVKTIVFDKLNGADRPNVKLEQVVENMKEEGAKIIFTTSDDFGAETLEVAKKFPDITFMHVSGDAVLKGTAPANLGNVMGRMEPMKMIAGCAAALQSANSNIAYLGPLINDETRRLVNSAYLGAKYCHTEYKKGKAEDLKFEVKWIGFWFNIPGVTLDPTEVANSFFNGGADVIISGIDTTEGIVVAGQRATKGEKVFAVPYDYRDSCSQAASVCLGVPYFNWGPSYVKLVTAIQAGTYKSAWDWIGPDWKDLNNVDTTNVGFLPGEGLTADNKATLDKFIAELASGKLNLFTGPLNYQDGTVFLKDKEVATDSQVWYAKQLIEGIKGDSQPPKK